MEQKLKSEDKIGPFKRQNKRMASEKREYFFLNQILQGAFLVCLERVRHGKYEVICWDYVW